MIWNELTPVIRTAHGRAADSTGVDSTGIDSTAGGSTVAGGPPSAQAPSMIGLMLLEYAESVKVMPPGICELVTYA